MGRDVVLAMGPLDSAASERLSRYGAVVEVAPLDRQSIARWLPDAIAIAARGTTVVDATVIGSAPRLRVIGRSGVGVDQVDLAAATARGIPVVVTPTAGTRAVAEGALALILHLVKRLGRFTQLVRDGCWTERELLPMGDLDEDTLGIVGYGRIGRRLAELAQVLGMQVLAFDPYVRADAVAPGVVLVDLHQLVARADVVSLHSPLTPETRGLVDAALLGLFKRGAILVNCGRGGLLDLDAAYDALCDGRLGGVGLDVYAVEPPADHPLFQHPDVVLTPHLMGLSRRARRLTFDAMAEGMASVLSGGRAPDVANPEVYA